MSKDNALKVYFNEDVLDLKENSISTSKSSRKPKSVESNTETSLPKTVKREIRKSGTKSPQNSRYPHTHSRKQNERAASVDSRFRRLRSSSPDEDKRSVVTVASHYSASLPIINQANHDKEKEERALTQNYGFDALGEGEGATGMRDLKQLSLATSKKDLIVEKEDEIIAPSEYCTAVYDAKADNPNDITTLLNYKYEYPISQNWGDPRLLKKYKSLFRPRKLKSQKSTWSLPVYTAPECQIKTIQPQNTLSKEDNNTYTYEEEDSDGELKKSKLSLIYDSPRLSWPLYFTACSLGALLVAFLAWYSMENDVVRKKLRRYFLKEEELEKSAITKITTSVLSTIVYVLNRIIKTTAHILVSPRSEVFAQPQENPWWKFYS